MFVLMSISCILCYTFQTFFNKLYSGAYRGPESAATPVFSVLYGVIVGAAALAANGGRFEASAVTWGLGLLNGSIMVLSALLSAVVLKEKLSKNTVAGIVLAAISLVLVNL